MQHHPLAAASALHSEPLLSATPTPAILYADGAHYMAVHKPHDIRMTPPSIAAAPMRAYVPARTLKSLGSTAEQASPKERPIAEPTSSEGMKRPAGTAEPVVRHMHKK